MLNRINDLLEINESFAFETTLATKSYKSKLIYAKEIGYKVTFIFFWLQSVDLAIERVKTRVLAGGHNIKSDVIHRRYKNGINNLFEIYFAIVDEIMIFDNSGGKPELIAEKTFKSELSVLNETKFNLLKKYQYGAI